jgi:hypothetical protein
MMSRGNGGTPRQERKRKIGGKKKQGSSGTGSPAGWKANQQKPVHHPALAGVDPGLLRDLRKWSACQTFKHQFRVVAAARVTAQPATPAAAYQSVKMWQPPEPGLAAVKHEQQQRAARGAVLAEVASREHPGPKRSGSAPSSLGELYALYKASGRLAEFHSLFPG